MGIASELIYGAEVPVPRRGSTAELSAIYMLSPQEGWAVGCADASAGAPEQDGDARDDAELEALFLHCVNGTWSRLRTPVRGRLTSMAMASAGDGWAVGEQGVIAYYDGTTWAPSGSIWPTWQRPTVRLHSPADGWIAGEGLGGTEKLPLLHYDGQGWTAAEWPAELAVQAGGIGPDLHLADLALSSSGEAWAVGTLVHVRQAEEPHRPADGIILHFDGGRWAVNAIIEACPLSSIAMPPTGPGWAAGRRNTLYERPGSSALHVRSDALLLRRDGGTWVEWEHPLGLGSEQPASSLWGLFMRSAKSTYQDRSLADRHAQVRIAVHREHRRFPGALSRRWTDGMSYRAVRHDRRCQLGGGRGWGQREYYARGRAGCLSGHGRCECQRRSMPHSSPRQHVCQEDGDQQRETQAKNQSPPRPCGEAGKAGLATSPRTRWANISDLQLIFTVMGIGLVLGN